MENRYVKHSILLTELSDSDAAIFKLGVDLARSGGYITPILANAGERIVFRTGWLAEKKLNLNKSTEVSV